MSTDKKAEQPENNNVDGKTGDAPENKSGQQDTKSGITELPSKDDRHMNETEGERRFKEGMVNNSDTDSGQTDE